MQILALGLNHETAPVALRERAWFSRESMQSALGEITRSSVAREAAILSTCNRTEIYCSHERIDQPQLVEWFSKHSGLAPAELRKSVYFHADENAVKHAFRVASGLDSMVLGEPQILGQIKDAFYKALDAGATGKVFNRLFQHTFSVAKQVRTDTFIGANPVSVAYAGVSLASRVFTSLSEQTALLIGAGETIELVARHLKEHNIKHMIVANRSIARAQSLANQVGCEVIALADIPAQLRFADIVVSSTASTLPILGKGAVEGAIRQRRHKPMFILDLAVPRDVEAQAGELDDVFLYTLDDLQTVVEQNRGLRQQATRQAENIIDLQVVRFMRWMRSLESEPTIRLFRSHVEQIRARALEQARSRIAKGVDPDKVLEQLSRDLSNKFAHRPSQQLKHADIDANPGLVSATKKLFGI